jgi:hypothetical protein
MSKEIRIKQFHPYKYTLPLVDVFEGAWDIVLPPLKPVVISLAILLPPPPSLMPDMEVVSEGRVAIKIRIPPPGLLREEMKEFIKAVAYPFYQYWTEAQQILDKQGEFISNSYRKI